MKILDTSFDKLLDKHWESILQSNKNNDYIKNFKSSYFLTQIRKMRRGIISHGEKLNNEFKIQYELEYKIFELFLLENLFLLFVLDNSFGLHAERFNKLDKESEQFKSLRTTSLLLHQVNNNLIVFLKLLNEGYNFQANLIFRNVIEQGSIITAVLFDSEFHKEIIHNSNIEDKKTKLKHWREKLTQRKIDEVLKQGYLSIGKSEEYCQLIFEIKETFYGEVSDYIHSDYGVSISNTYTSKQRGDEIVDRNLFGSIDSNIGYTFSQSLSYLKILFFDIKQIIIKKHKISFSDFEGGYSIAAISTLKDKLFEEYLIKFAATYEK